MSKQEIAYKIVEAIRRGPRNETAEHWNGMLLEYVYDYDAEPCTEPMTIREAFAKAGCPVHQTAWLVYWPLPNVSDKAWFMLDHNDPKGTCFYWLAHGEWHPVTEHFGFDESDLLRGQVYESIDIGDLPVTKFIETLLPVEWVGRHDHVKAESE